MPDVRVLTADEILAADDFTTEFVAVPEWADGDDGVGVYVRTMSGTDRDKLEASIFADGKRRNLHDLRAKLCSLCIVGDDRKTRLFTDHQLDALGQKSAAALDRVFAIAQRLNGMTADDVEELAKNSASGPAADSM